MTKKTLAPLAVMLLFLSSCSGTSVQRTETHVQKADANGIAIAAEFDAPDVRQLAQAHCAKFGKSAVVADAVPIGDTVTSGWAGGVKPYLFSYDCL